MQLVEAVPNFSTCDTNIVNEITKSIEEHQDTFVLNIDINIDYNRTVITFTTTLDQLMKVSLSCISTALYHIDMTRHFGEHPRLGAVDVFPLIPLNNTSKSKLISISHSIAKLVGEQFKIPVFCYAESVIQEKYRSLTKIRNKQYEGIKHKLENKNFTPDFGPPIFSPKSGAIVIGVRKILIAYNVNLKTDDKNKANAISRLIRTSGYSHNGKNIPGKLQGVQALGFKISSNRQFTQVSTNILNYKKYSTIHDVYQLVKYEASKMNIQISGSELVGLTPIAGLLKESNDLSYSDLNLKIKSQVNKLGLHDLYKFVPADKILEFQLKKYYD